MTGAPAGGAIYARDHRSQLGLDRGHRRQSADRSRRAGRSVHAGQRCRLQGQGPRRLGASTDLVFRLEPGRARHERGRRRRGPCACGASDTSAARARRQFGIDLPPYVLKAAWHQARWWTGRRARADDDERLTQPGVAAPWSSPTRTTQCFSARSSRARARGSRGGWRIRSGTYRLQQWNTAAEIRGSEQAGQVVILGAHLDSWDLGTHTDNGTGSMVVLEAARVLAQSGLNEAHDPLHPVQRRGGRTARLRQGACRRRRQHPATFLAIDNGNGAIRGGAAGAPGARRMDVARAGGHPRCQCSARSKLRHRPSESPFRMGSQASTSISSRVATPIPTTHRATPTTRRFRGDLVAVMAVTAYELANLPDLSRVAPSASRGGAEHCRRGRRRRIEDGAEGRKDGKPVEDGGWDARAVPRLAELSARTQKSMLFEACPLPALSVTDRLRTRWKRHGTWCRTRPACCTPSSHSTAPKRSS